jgi:hypothetical protein
MSEILKIVLPSIIVLIGTIFASMLGYRQWKRQQKLNFYIKEKREVYKEFWDKLENIHIKLRTEDVNQPEFDHLLQELNAFALKNNIFIDKLDQSLADYYLDNIYKFKNALKSSNNKKLQKDFHDTTILRPEDVGESSDLTKFFAEANKARFVLLKKVQNILKQA